MSPPPLARAAQAEETRPDTPRPETRRYQIELRGRYVEELDKLAAEHLYDDPAAYAAVLLRNTLWEISEHKRIAALRDSASAAADPDQDIPF